MTTATPVRKTYRSRSGRHYFKFDFLPAGTHIDIYCPVHPGLNGRDSSVTKTHLYDSGQICFVEGQEPRSQREAEHRAAQWAEYYLNYIATGSSGG